MVRPFNEREAWAQERAELPEQIAALQCDLDATRSAGLGGAPVVAGIWLIERWFVNLKVGGDQVLLQILVFSTKAVAFVFGSGLATSQGRIIPSR